MQKFLVQKRIWRKTRYSSLRIFSVIFPRALENQSTCQWGIGHSCQRFWKTLCIITMIWWHLLKILNNIFHYNILNYLSLYILKSSGIGDEPRNVRRRDVPRVSHKPNIGVPQRKRFTGRRWRKWKTIAIQIGLVHFFLGGAKLGHDSSFPWKRLDFYNVDNGVLKRKNWL